MNRRISRRDLLTSLGKKMINSFNQKFYKINVDDEGCILCGACVYICPREVFKIVSGDGGYSLLVNDGRCDGCGKCIENCPEKVLSLKEVESTSNVYREAASSPMERCRRCGKVIGPAKMIERVANRLRSQGMEKYSELVYLCNECKRSLSRGV